VCGGDGQRACCSGEAFDGCRPGHNLVQITNAERCFFRPWVRSRGVCVADTPCGGAGQRTCCLGESAFGECRAGLTPRYQANGAKCSRSLSHSNGVCE
jgi:hypothetical protein